MFTEEIKIPTDGRPIEAFTMYQNPRPGKALLILPGKGYTINHFLLDFIWRMAAEQGFYSIKAEYRGFTYRHLNEPYEIKDAAKDVEFLFKFLEETGYSSRDITVCGKSLGTITLADTITRLGININKAVLLTPVLYFAKELETLPFWDEYKKRVKNSYLVFGSDDPFCDLETARAKFPNDQIDFYPGADHGLHLNADYARTIEIQREIVEKVKEFIAE